MNDLIEKIKSLPKSWDELSFGMYLLLLNSKSIEDDYQDDETDSLSKQYQRAKEAIRTLTGASIEEIEQLPLSVTNEALNRLSFMSTPMPKPKVENLIKKVDEITFQNFVDYINYSKNVQSYYQNFTKILPLFTDITEQEILDAPAHYIFFLVDDVKKKSRRLMRISILSTINKIIKLMMNRMIGKMKKIFKKSK